MSHQIVWFKKDLRIHDHRPLADASNAGSVLPVYVYEPALYQTPEFHPTRLQFLNECLVELDEKLQSRGSFLIRRRGNPVDVFAQLHDQWPIEGLWSHQETGSWMTYERDEDVRTWASNNGVNWKEQTQNGVIRGPYSRDGWSDEWERRQTREVIDPPDHIQTPTDIDRGRVFQPEDLDLSIDLMSDAQTGGRKRGTELLNSFLSSRGKRYRSGMSSPVSARHDCSRLSPHLTFGTVSMKEVYQATKERQNTLRQQREEGQEIDGNWLQSLSMFTSRLHWRCHFMQKLEDEPRMEFENLATVYDGLREDEFNEEHFVAWKKGQTGFPMVDACMRALHDTGWINFRMRAMLMSFSSYHLWQHWRRPGQWLARHFLDFEPGIHWPQVQMQSGTTGINAIRIYNPTKQVEDQDPTGEFIREWVPELQDVPDEYIADPSDMPRMIQKSSGFTVGEQYPEPLVDGKKAWKQARDRIWAVKDSEEAQREADKIYEKHGSRRNSNQSS